jgi:hypothetical protein
VGCLEDVAKLLKKHSSPKQRLDKEVHTRLQQLKPSTKSVGVLLERLEAAVRGQKGAPSM